VAQITLIAKFQPDGPVTFDRLADPTDALPYSGEFLPGEIHIHGEPGIAVSILAANVEGKCMTYEQVNRFRDALNAEIAKYGHRPLPPDVFSMFRRRV
jgi:hypothetical protein